jgi:hypothetical protein
MGRRARIPWWWRRLITVRVLMWPPNAKLPRSAPAVLNGRCRVLSFIFYWFGMVRRKLTIPERWQAVGMHNGGFSHRRVTDHFRANHSIFEISSLLEKILLKQVRWCLTFVGLYSLICSFLITISLCLLIFQLYYRDGQFYWWK